MQRYALLCPTRGRPERAAEAARSAFQTAAKPERIEYLYYVDSDDPDLAAYQSMVPILADELAGLGGKVELTVGPPVGVLKAFNKLTESTDADVFMVATDDQIFVDADWDLRLDLETAKFSDGIYCMWFNDNWESKNFCTAPIVSRVWIETLGYFLLPLFEHFFADAWIWMLAKAVDRAVYIPDILVEHRHWKSGKAEMDETYERNASQPGDSRHARDRAVIDRFERYFLADTELLQKSMK